MEFDMMLTVYDSIITLRDGVILENVPLFFTRDGKS